MGIQLVKNFILFISLAAGTCSFAQAPKAIQGRFSHSLDDGYSKSKKEKIQLSILSEKQAEHLFKIYSQMEFLEYGFTLDGCSARAHEISKMLEKNKFQSGKIFVEGNLRTKVQQKNPLIPSWDWHVAPVVAIRKDGVNQLMVIDPALFDHPVTIEEFKAALTDPKNPQTKISELYFGSRFQYEPRKYESQKKNWYSSDFAKSRAHLKQNHFFSESIKNLEKSKSTK